MEWRARELVLFAAVITVTVVGSASAQVAATPTQGVAADGGGVGGGSGGASCVGNCAFCVGCVDGTVESCECCCEPSCREAGDCCEDFEEVCADVDMREILGISEDDVEDKKREVDGPEAAPSAPKKASLLSSSSNIDETVSNGANSDSKNNETMSNGDNNDDINDETVRNDDYDVNNDETMNNDDNNDDSGDVDNGSGTGNSSSMDAVAKSSRDTFTAALAPVAAIVAPVAGVRQQVQYVTIRYGEDRDGSNDNGNNAASTSTSSADDAVTTINLYGDGPPAPPRPSAPYPPVPPLPIRPPGPAGPPGPPALASNLQDWSWNSRVDFAVPDSPRGDDDGFSVGVVAGSYGGFAIGNRLGFTREAKDISFCIKSGEEEGYSLNFRFEDTESDASVDVIELSAPARGGWRCHAVEIGGRVRNFVDRNTWDKITFQDTGRRSTFYLSDIEVKVPPGVELSSSPEKEEDDEDDVENAAKNGADERVVAQGGGS